jgi:glycerol-3-phosphate acyltransferase PlsX
VWTRISAIIALPVLRRFKRQFDHRRYNGAILLGLRGVSVKSHGSADSFSFEHAINRAFEAVRNRVVDRISARMAELAAPTPAAQESV